MNVSPSPETCWGAEFIHVDEAVVCYALWVVEGKRVQFSV